MKTRNAMVHGLLSLLILTLSACASSSIQHVTPSTTIAAVGHQAQNFVEQPTPGCDYSGVGCPWCTDINQCWILPCLDCIAPIPVLDEGTYIDGGGGGITPISPPPDDPIDRISVPNPSDTGQLPSPGDTVQCVNFRGGFTTGCGGVPGQDGRGIGVFYDTSQTCYFNFTTQASVCFAVTNAPPRVPPPPGGDRTTTYCYDTKKLRTQHWYTVPDSDAGVETLDTYIDTAGMMEGTFTLFAPHASIGVTLWISAGPNIVIPDSTSHIQMYALESVPLIPFIKVPVYVGYALRTHTDSLCAQSL